LLRFDLSQWRIIDAIPMRTIVLAANVELSGWATITEKL